MVSYNEYYNRSIGRGYNVDGYYGAQCWDGFADYCQFLGVPVVNCTNTGYARDLWEQRAHNGILNGFIEVSVMQPGDVAVFAVTNSTPYSHVTIFHADAGNGFGWFFGQNQGGTPYPGGGSCYNLVKLPYSATYATAFRPKAFTAPQVAKAPAPQAVASANSNWIAESATFTSSYAIYAREGGPSTNNKSPYLFPAGSRINYDAYCHANGFVWIRQPRSGGGYWYIPTGESNGTKRTGPAWGSFA